nr:MAG TPA_asm: hypothetical protein [Caudoviricetes sp.]
MSCRNIRVYLYAQSVWCLYKRWKGRVVVP